ncbi:MAG: flavocytochrome c [Burkholderiaceae bacterium]|nr:flavocytochrome c [Burkholderiaceae bacterium]
MKKIVIASLVSSIFAIPAIAAEQADIVVIGAGGAGLSAAVTAHDLGKKVVVLEKMAYLGGNTNRAAGGLNAAESKPQAKLGIKDTIESHFNDTMKGGKNLNNPDLVRVLTTNAAASVDFINGLGGDLNDVGMMAGASQKRSHRPTGGGFVGAEVVKTLVNASKQRNIDIRTMAKAEELVVKDGRVVGVKYKQRGKAEQTINAKAVIIAAGGFSANQELVTKINPKLKGFATTNHSGATGDGIVLGQKIGADTVDMNQIQTHPTVVPGKGEMITEAVRGNGAILVNKDGKRFINELQTRDVVSAAELQQPGKVGYLLFDQDVRKSLKAIESYIKSGLVTEGKTLDELASKLKINATNLKATMSTYAKDQAAKKDSQFGRADMPRPLTTAPYYAVEVTPAVHHTMGGLKINTSAQVIDTNGKIIPGLYAAGEVTGGVHGANRLGGNAMADITTFGRIAGKNAAAE